MTPSPVLAAHWLRTGDEAFAAMLSAIDAARHSVRLETYIFAAGSPGDQFLEALVNARLRGARVQVLLDAFGSLDLPDSYWNALRRVGGEMRWFNRLSLERFNIRNHRKLLVCDDSMAFVGGLNIAPPWLGDGVALGWRDLGLQLSGGVAGELARSFDEMHSLADFQHKRFVRFRRSHARKQVHASGCELLLSGPGRGHSPIRRALQHDLSLARTVQIIAAYFLPPLRLRRALTRVARRGGRVQLILPGKSDVPLMQAASRNLYQRLLRAGVEICEYEPQILHTKFVLIDDTAYMGSANLDPRSLGINYDLLLRLPDPALAAEGRRIFAEHLALSRPIEPKAWRRGRSFWAKLRERFACLLFTRIDPYVTRRQLQGLR
jgi:cardiolipin synthase A/B